MKKSPVLLMPRKIGVSRLPSPCAKPTPGTYLVASAMLCAAVSRICSLVTTEIDWGVSRSSVSDLVAVVLRGAA